MKFLYSSSLENHMRDYMKNVRLTELNEQYQKQQNDIVREGELMNLSQADIMNKIKMMQQTLKDNIANKLIPIEKTNAPELPKQKKEFVKPTIKTSPKSGSPKKTSPEGKRAPTLEEITNVKLKKTPSPKKKEKVKSPLQKELEEKLSPSSTQATTASTSTSSPTSNEKNLSISQSSSALRKEVKEWNKNNPDKQLNLPPKGSISTENQRKVRAAMGK